MFAPQGIWFLSAACLPSCLLFQHEETAGWPESCALRTFSSFWEKTQRRSGLRSRSLTARGCGLTPIPVPSVNPGASDQEDSSLVSWAGQGWKALF